MIRQLNKLQDMLDALPTLDFLAPLALRLYLAPVFWVDGIFVVSNNGIEWAATYFIMLLTLFLIGAGRYLSVDSWIARRYRNTA